MVYGATRAGRLMGWPFACVEMAILWIAISEGVVIAQVASGFGGGLGNRMPL